MRVAVLGTGALGCLYAARLADYAEVWMAGTWAEGIAAVQRAGIQIVGPDGQTSQAHVYATTDPGAVPPVEYALVLVKSHQTARSAAWAAQILALDGLAVTLQKHSPFAGISSVIVN